MKLNLELSGNLVVLRLISMALLALSCVACGMNLRPDPADIEPSLAGQWHLLTQREALAAQLRTAMEQAQAKQVKRFRHRVPYDAPAGEPVSSDDIPPPEAAPGATLEGPGGPPRRNTWWMREQREQQEALLNALLPSTNLRIIQSMRRIELIPDIGAVRRFDTGVDSTLVSTYATLRIESGWQGNVFVIHSRDGEQGIDIVERYQRRDATHLYKQVQLKMPDAKEQLFTADYSLTGP